MKKIKLSIKNGQLSKKAMNQVVAEAVQKEIITPEEHKTLIELEIAKNDILKVDDFSWEEFSSLE